MSFISTIHEKMVTEDDNEILFRVQYLSVVASIVAIRCDVAIPILGEDAYTDLVLQYIEAILMSYVGEAKRGEE